MSIESTASAPRELLPPPDQLRSKLAVAMRDVTILAGLLRLAERVERQTGRAVKPGRTVTGEGTRE
jgi:hypothetical protein